MSENHSEKKAPQSDKMASLQLALFLGEELSSLAAVFEEEVRNGCFICEFNMFLLGHYKH